MLQKQVKTQQVHEMKKKEKEYIKLQVGNLPFFLLYHWELAIHVHRVGFLLMKVYMSG
jgi:hypothetical protein